MIEVLNINKRPNHKRLGILSVKYHDLIMKCDLCLYEEKHLWVRMPEIWSTNTYKNSYVWWPSKELSSKFQREVIEQVQKKTGLTLEKAIEIKRKAMEIYYSKKASSGKNQKNMDLNKN